MLEVDASPLRATKGGVWGGEDPRYAWGQGGPRRILPYVGSFFALVAHFFAFLTHLKLSHIFLTIFCDFSSIFGGFGRDFERIFGEFSVIFGDFFGKGETL